MYFSRIRLDPGADTARLARELAWGSAYREHQLLWRLFDDDPDARRDFLFRREDAAELPQYFVLSQRKPEDRRGLWRVETKAYQPRLYTGQRLGFSLRANPVVTRRDAEGRHCRHDIVMDAKKSPRWAETAPAQRESLPQLIQEAGSRWLQPRLARLGAQVRSHRAEGYRQHKTYKGRAAKPIGYSTLDFTGSLTVTDPEAFGQVLRQGIGPAKAFGCGLLLIRPI